MTAGAAADDGGATYALAGVDIDAGGRAVDAIRSLVRSTTRPEVLGEIGDFAGLFALDPTRYRRPVLVASTDGVGTKALVAQSAGRFDTIGIDLVAMCVDDLVCQGAEPLFLLDYIATGVIEPAQIRDLVAGVAAGCRKVGAALLGGEMAEHAGVMEAGAFDLAGCAVGVVEQDRILGSGRVQPGDQLIGLASPGLRSNGYTLARHVLLDHARLDLAAPAWEGSDQTLADVLLLPSELYTPAVRSTLEVADVHAVAHVTGGGIPGNVPRVLGTGLRAVVDRSAWIIPRIFTEIRRLGSVDDDEMARVFNLGIGMVLVVAEASTGAAVAALTAAGTHPAVIGTVEVADPGDQPEVVFGGAWRWEGDT